MLGRLENRSFVTRGPGGAGDVGENGARLVVHGVEEVGEARVDRGRVDRPAGILLAQKRGVCSAESLRQNIHTSHLSRSLNCPSAILTQDFCPSIPYARTSRATFWQPRVLGIRVAADPAHAEDDKCGERAGDACMQPIGCAQAKDAPSDLTRWRVSVYRQPVTVGLTHPSGARRLIRPFGLHRGRAR